VTEFVGTFIENWSYFGLFFILLACGFGLPLPEDIPLLFSGWLVHRGHANLWIMMTVGMLGVLGGDSIMYGLGRRYGEHIVEHPWLMRLITRRRLEWAEQKFLSRGAPLIFVARFMTGARSVVFLTSGMFRVPFWKFLLMDGTAALISVPLWIILAAYFGDRAEALVEKLRDAGAWAVAGAIAVVAIWFLWRRRRRKSRMALEEQAAAALAAAQPEAASAPVTGETRPALLTDPRAARAAGGKLVPRDIAPPTRA